MATLASLTNVPHGDLAKALLNREQSLVEEMAEVAELRSQLRKLRKAVKHAIAICERKAPEVAAELRAAI